MKTLGDTIRLCVIKELTNHGEMTCACFNIRASKSALSHHYKVLRESGLIHVRIEGKQHFLSIRSTEIEERFPGLLQAIIKNL